MKKNAINEVEITIVEKFKTLFDLAVPIIQGPMGGISGPNLVAAVASAGALGILPVWFQNVDKMKNSIAQTQALTDKPFGINIRADLIQLDHVAAAIDAGVTIIHSFWGNSRPLKPVLSDNNIRLVATVVDEETAKAALDVGAVCLIVQGVEAGGHILGTTPRDLLFSQILKIAGDVPIIAAGGLASAKDLKEMILLGSAGALFGTRFILSHESEAHQLYKSLLVEAGVDATVRPHCFDGAWANAPHRTLKNSTYEQWNMGGRPSPGGRPGEEDIILSIGDVLSIPRYHMAAPNKKMSGDIEAAALYSGSGVARITDITSAATIIAQLTTGLD